MSTESDVEFGPEIRSNWSIPAREIKRRGISALDEALRDGPVHVIRNDRPTYVVMLEEDYQLLMEDAGLAEQVRVRAAMKELAQGGGRTTTAEELIRELKLD